MASRVEDFETRPSRAATIRRVLVFTVAAACLGVFVYTRYIVKKGGLGERCSVDLQCSEAAPRCLKPDAEEDGVCSRSCAADGDCQEGVRCIEVEVDDRDERGNFKKQGYCFPQAVLDARKAKSKRDGGAEGGKRGRSETTWLEPHEGGLEGEIVVDRAGSKATFEIKGSLVRLAPSGSGHVRTIADTTSLRVFEVDDAKQQFSASTIPSPTSDVLVKKAGREDKVGDQPCQVWTLEEGAKNREVCAIQGAALVDPRARTVAPWERELATRSLLPLQVREGTETKLTVRFTPRPLDARGFTIPKAYKNLR
jgi:hypothetical protein